MTRRNLRTLAAMLLFLLLTGCSGEKPEALVASAKGLLAKNDTNAAIIQLRNALQKNPDLAEARFLLGKVELETGDLAGAQKELRRALELKYPPDDAIPPLAEAMLRSGEFKKVIDEFGKAVAKAPEAPAADLPAPLAAAMQQLGVAKKEADKSDTVVVTTPEARAALQTTVGKAQLALRNAEAADAAFAAALAAKADYPPALLGQAMLAAGKGDLPGALLLLGSALEKSPQLVEGWEFQGQIQLAQGQQDDALASYRKALEAKRDYLPATRGDRVVARRPGQARGRVEAARRDAKARAQGIRKRSTCRRSWRTGSKDFAAARESIQQLLAVAPEDLNALLLAGAIDFELKSYTQAEANLLKVLSAAPDQPFARRLLVGTYLRTGQPGKALEALKPVLDKIGNDSALLTLAGEVYMQNGNANEASRYFEKAAMVDPKDTGSKTSLALVHMAQGDTSQAMRELEQTVGEDTTTRSDLALIALHVRQREYAKALTAIDALEKKEPSNPLAATFCAAQSCRKRTIFRVHARVSSVHWRSILPISRRRSALPNWIWRTRSPTTQGSAWKPCWPRTPSRRRHCWRSQEMRAMAGGSADEVAALIGKAIAANPSEVAPRLALIAHYLRSKDPKKAVAAGQDALAAIPDRPEILEALGQAQQAAGDPNQAIATYSKWARLRPSSPLPWLRIAEAQIAAKDSQRGLAEPAQGARAQAGSGRRAARDHRARSRCGSRATGPGDRTRGPEAASQGSDRLPSRG